MNVEIVGNRKALSTVRNKKKELKFRVKPQHIPSRSD